MRQNDITRFAEMMMLLGEIYNRDISNPQVKIYWKVLQRYELKDIEQAFHRHVQDPDAGQYFPKPADVVRQVDGNSQSRALQAWTKVEKAMRHIGGYSSVVFDDPLIHAVMSDMGGWIVLTQVRAKDLPFRSHEFVKRYQAYLHQKPSHWPRVLTGIHDRDNRSQGFSVTQEPVLIGDVRQCQQLMAEQQRQPLLDGFITEEKACIK